MYKCSHFSDNISSADDELGSISDEIDDGENQVEDEMRIKDYMEAEDDLGAGLKSSQKPSTATKKVVTTSQKTIQKVKTEITEASENLEASLETSNDFAMISSRFLSFLPTGISKNLVPALNKVCNLKGWINKFKNI